MATKIKRLADSWHLENIELKAEDDPDLHFPSRPCREGIPVSYFAKLVFVSEGPFYQERLWVEVTHKVGPCYEGILKTGPAHSPLKDYLMVGQKINFFAHNVMGISPPGKDHA